MKREREREREREIQKKADIDRKIHGKRFLCPYVIYFRSIFDPATIRRCYDIDVDFGAGKSIDE